MQRDAPTSTTPPRRRLLLLATGTSVLALVGAAAVIWFVWFSSAAPTPASLDEAIGAVGSASPGASAAPDPSPSAMVDASAGPSAEPTADGVDGSWTVDTSIGSFADYTSSFAGFRVDEVLSSIGSTTAIGRTPNVTGERRSPAVR